MGTKSCKWSLEALRNVCFVNDVHHGSNGETTPATKSRCSEGQTQVDLQCMRHTRALVVEVQLSSELWGSNGVQRQSGGRKGVKGVNGGERYYGISNILKRVKW